MPDPAEEEEDNNVQETQQRPNVLENIVRRTNSNRQGQTTMEGGNIITTGQAKSSILTATQIEQAKNQDTVALARARYPLELRFRLQFSSQII